VKHKLKVMHQHFSPFYRCCYTNTGLVRLYARNVLCLFRLNKLVTLKMGAARFSETSEQTCYTTRYQNQTTI